MTRWPAQKARRVLAALLRIGWSIKRETAGSHRILSRAGWPDYVFSFHEGEEIGPHIQSADPPKGKSLGAGLNEGVFGEHTDYNLSSNVTPFCSLSRPIITS